MPFAKVRAAGFLTHISEVVLVNTSVKIRRVNLGDDPFPNNGSEVFKALQSVTAAQSLIHFQVGCVRYSFREVFH